MQRKMSSDVEAFAQAAIQLERLVRELCGAIEACEKAQHTREDIATLLLPLRVALAIDARPLLRNAFDLVLTDGRLDTLSNADAVALLETVYRVLAPGGKFIFTAHDGDDPDYPLLRHLGELPLVARNEKKILECFDKARISRRNVTLQREGRVLRIEVQKLE